MRFRRVVSLFLLVGVAFLLLTILILYIVPHGRVAYWTNWRLWGLSKDDWTHIHINLGLLLLISAGLHVYYNWGPLTNYLKNRSRRMVIFTAEFSAALAMIAVVLVTTHLGVPPLSWVLDLNESVKDAASQRYGEPPYGHAELSTLETLTRRLALPLGSVLDELQAADYREVRPDATLEEIAAANRVTPQAIYETMQGAVENASSLPKIPPPGTGKKRLREVAGEYDLELEVLIERLASRGIAGRPEQTLQEIAAEHQINPDAVYEALKPD
ncbi:MAG: DUF4405 domain-containing protein [Candidatus Eisenbacteria bacterium]|nr:DUF4405 domain-containing protein [Candidatus Eisenbacteria bacterium]